MDSPQHDVPLHVWNPLILTESLVGSSLRGPLNMERRVVITGIGVVSPNGIGTEAFWSATSKGISGVGPITRFDTTGLAVRVAGEVKDFREED